MAFMVYPLSHRASIGHVSGKALTTYELISSPFLISDYEKLYRKSKACHDRLEVGYKESPLYNFKMSLSILSQFFFKVFQALSTISTHATLEYQCLHSREGRQCRSITVYQTVFLLWDLSLAEWK